METAVRGYSQLGNPQKIAEAIAEETGVKAVSVAEEPALTEQEGVLFLGGAPYADMMAPLLGEYAERLSSDKIWARRSFYCVTPAKKNGSRAPKKTHAKSIRVEKRHFCEQMTQIIARVDPAKEFVRIIAK